MFFTASLYVSLVIFGIGLLFRVSTWFRYSLHPAAGELSFAKRVSAAVKGILLTVFSVKILRLIKVFFLDVLLQAPTFKESLLRWRMHMLIYGEQ